MNKQYKYLSKNILLFAISSIGTKMITFLLIPLYTNYLTTKDYGIIDLIGSITNIAIPVFSLSLESAVLRFCLDEKYADSNIFGSSIYIWGRAVILNLFFIIALYVVGIFDEYNNFLLYYGIFFICYGMRDIIVSYCRGLDKVEVMVETSIISAATLCIFNIFMLTVLKLEMSGYIFATIGSSFLSILWALYRIKSRVRITYDKKTTKDLQSYGAPLIFNQIGWWLNNSVDKYIVIMFEGISLNGIYSIAYKIPTIMSVMSSVISNAWSLSAIKEYGKEESERFASEMYNIYNAFLTVCCSIFLILNVPIAKLLFAKDFFAAWEISGILVLSSVFNGLSGFLGAFFSASKDTKSYAVSTISGGLINVVVSFVLVQHFGIKGVAFGTLLSYVCIWVIRYKKSQSYIKINISFSKHAGIYILLLIECFLGMKGAAWYIIFPQVSIVILVIVLNRSEIKFLLDKIKRSFK